MELTAEQVRAYVDYLRDMGVYDLYRRAEAQVSVPAGLRAAIKARAAGTQESAAGRTAVRKPAAPQGAVPDSVRRAGSGAGLGAGHGASAVKVPERSAAVSPFERAQARAAGVAPGIGAANVGVQAPLVETPKMPEAPPAYDFEVSMPKPVSFNDLAPLPAVRVPAAERAKALESIRAEIGDCTRCPLAYAGRHTIVFADGNPQAELMFVGEGPGADEDASGLPFVGKAGQLLNNMIGAMGLQREDVYIANVVKCRPPQNRVPEPVEANTCSPFLLRQIDVVQPKVIVALGATAATYLLGVRQSLASLRGQWWDCRGAKVAVTYHPAFLLRDPRQKGEAWKDLQRVMGELGLKPKPKA